MAVVILVLIIQLFVDLAMLPRVMSEHHRSSEEHPSQGQEDKRECFQRSGHISFVFGSASYSVATLARALIAREERA